MLSHNPQLDAAILDLNLAGETSGPIAVALAERGVPYVIVTGSGRGAVPEAERWASGLINKPFEPEQVVAKLVSIWSAPAPR